MFHIRDIIPFNQQSRCRHKEMYIGLLLKASYERGCDD